MITLVLNQKITLSVKGNEIDPGLPDDMDLKFTFSIVKEQDKGYLEFGPIIIKEEFQQYIVDEKEIRAKVKKYTLTNLELVLNQAGWETCNPIYIQGGARLIEVFVLTESLPCDCPVCIMRS